MSFSDQTAYQTDDRGTKEIIVSMVSHVMARSDNDHSHDNHDQSIAAVDRFLAQNSGIRSHLRWETDKEEWWSTCRHVWQYWRKTEWERAIQDGISQAEKRREERLRLHRLNKLAGDAILVWFEKAAEERLGDASGSTSASSSTSVSQAQSSGTLETTPETAVECESPKTLERHRFSDLFESLYPQRSDISSSNPCRDAEPPKGDRKGKNVQKRFSEP
ncbi:hypothetical protein F5Y18DRAFT_130382 [Xylariaceae sp. FL1019]|nr:hypothetical protein F5Y18DRAFT_130382 [Xylariaceae sp. FL1019]